MRYPKVFYHPIEGSAPLTITFSSAPKGDAIEAKNGIGVGFFSEEGRLLSVIFDDVKAKKDHQFLKFKAGLVVEIKMQNNKVSICVHHEAQKIAG